MASFNPTDPNAAERQRDLALTQSNSFIVTATTMLLGVLAGIAESKSRPASDGGTHHQQGLDESGPPIGAHDVHDAQPTQPAHDPALTSAEPHVNAAPHGNDFGPIETAVVAHPTYVTHAGHSAASDASAAMHHDAPAIPPAMPTDIASAAAGESSHVFSFSPQLSELGGTLSHSIDDAVTSILHSAAPVTDTAATLMNSVLSIPDSAVGSLVSATFGSAGAAAGELIDTASIAHVDLPMSPLALLGQAHTDGQDHHDGAFSAIGVHHF